MLLLPDGRLGPADDLEQQRSDLDRRAPAAAIPCRRVGPPAGRAGGGAGERDEEGFFKFGS